MTKLENCSNSENKHLKFGTIGVQVKITGKRVCKNLKLIRDNSYTLIDFEGDKALESLVDKALETGIGIKEEGYQYAKAYQLGLWNGITKFHEKVPEGIRFPSGLTADVDEILGGLQNKVPFQYEIIDDRPDPFMDVSELPENIQLLDENGEPNIILRDYQYRSVKASIEKRTGILHIATNGGKSFTAAGIIKQLLPKLMTGERVAVFVPSKAIFNQLHRGLEEALGIKVGKYGSGKKQLEKVTVAMIPTVYAAYKADPEKGVKLTAKERVIKKMANEIVPQFAKGVNQRMLMKAYIHNFQVKTKADEDFLAEIQKVIDKSESDAKAIFNLNQYTVKYQKILRTKNEKAFKKKKEVMDFLNSVAVMIVDEVHHVSGDSFYHTFLGCENAMYRIGMTGSIEMKNKIMTQRLKAIFGTTISRVRNEEMIDRGISAKPKIVMVPITSTVVEGEEVDITSVPDYMQAYEAGIVQNDYRNIMLAKLTEIGYSEGKGVLIVLNRLDHGDRISGLLDNLNVPHEFVKGELEDEEREVHFQAMREGKLKVMISTSLIDEGVDISGIDVLIMAGAGKSLRQTLQRIGRALRKKKVGENKAVIYDTIDRTNKYLYDHSKQRLKIYENEKFDIEILE